VRELECECVCSIDACGDAKRDGIAVTLGHADANFDAERNDIAHCTCDAEQHAERFADADADADSVANGHALGGSVAFGNAEHDAHSSARDGE